MRYLLNYAPPAQQFLDGLTLSRLGRIRLFGTLDALRTVSDAERLDPANRAGPYFVFRGTFREGRQILPVRFVVDDDSASYGVLKIVYGDLT